MRADRPGQPGAVRRRLDALRLAGRSRRAGRSGDAARGRRRRGGRPPSRRAGALLDDRSAGADHDRLRAGRTRRGDGAAAAQRRRAMVPRLFRARLGQRPGVADHPRRRSDGDNWVVNGQKVWTSFAQYSTRCILLTRTAPGYDGITAFFVDLDTPGITVRPLRTMHGVDEFCEVYFDDVVVPAAACSASPATAGGSRWTCCPTSAPPASGSASRTCTHGSTR